MDKLNPRVLFEFQVEKIVGVSIDGTSYLVQWAPTWVSKLHLVGCEHLIEEFLQKQSEGVKTRPEFTDGSNQVSNNQCDTQLDLVQPESDVVNSRQAVAFKVEEAEVTATHVGEPLPYKNIRDLPNSPVPSIGVTERDSSIISRSQANDDIWDNLGDNFGDNFWDNCAKGSNKINSTTNSTTGTAESSCGRSRPFENEYAREIHLSGNETGVYLPSDTDCTEHPKQLQYSQYSSSEEESSDEEVEKVNSKKKRKNVASSSGEESEEAAPLKKVKQEGNKRKANVDARARPSKTAKTESLSVFLGGLSYSTEVEGLKSFLNDNEVNPTDVRIIAKNGKSRGFGYAEFDSKEESKKCIDLHGAELDGHYISCGLADRKPTTSGRGDRGGGRGRGFGSGGRGSVRGAGGGGGGGGSFDNDTPTTLLMVKNLSWNTDNDSLFNVFSKASDARVVMDKETGTSRGFAFVEYSDVDTAKKARETNQGKDIDGRQMNIVFATPREKSNSGRRGSGGSGGGGRGRGFSGGRGRGGRGGRGGSARGGSAADKGSLQKLKGAKLTFDEDSY